LAVLAFLTASAIWNLLLLVGPTYDPSFTGY
jgi:hypothetical protein